MTARNLIINLFLIVGITAFGQQSLKTENRLEIQLKDGYNNEAIYRCSKGFFVMEAFAEKKVNGQQEIRYNLYDSQLKECGENPLNIPGEMKELLSWNNDSCIYKMYTNKKNVFLLSSVSITDLKTSQVSGTLPRNIKLLNMRVLGEKAWFQAVIKKKNCMFQVNLKTGKTLQSSFIEKKWNKKTSIVNYQMTPQSDELLVFMNRYIKRGVCELSQTNVNGSCELCDTIRLTGTGDKLLTSVSGSRISPTEMVYSGTYSRYNARKAEGLFFTKSTNNRLDFIRYLNFLDIKSFVSQQTKLEKTVTNVIRKVLKKSTPDFGINYNVTTHDIIKITNGYLLIGELYEPCYHSVPITNTVVINGMVSTRTTYIQVFDGYQYTNAIMVAFAEDGTPLWDQSFSMYASGLTMYPYKHIKVSDKKDKQISMVFSDHGVIVSKVIDFDGSVLVNENHQLIDTGNTKEKTSRSYSNVDYWYDNYFLVYGSQTVKNTDNKTNRKVFYVNKISL